jgi:hypothetical protein
MPRTHPEVTAATAKELYANAINCASPECDRPLYRVNEDRSRTLNTRIAHICARQEYGPRWDPEMSPEANRSVDNLLVLCIEHADEVDRPERVGLYPVALLHEWKAQQLALFDERQGGGWDITQEEAEEVIRESTSLEVSIQGEVINLGGAGGQALSAGGGGGAAIGRGAKGGEGGPGGPIRINLRGEAGVAPGAGGGGAGYIDPDSPLFWQGGDQMPTFGSFSFLGIDGQDGGDTTFGPADGGEVLRAKGGRGGLAGTGNRSKSDKLVASALMLVNYVEFRENFAYITGTGFQQYHVLNLRDPLTLTGMITLEGGGVPLGEYALTVEAWDPQNNVATSVRLVFEVSRTGDILRMCFRFTLRVVVNIFGMWTIVARHEDRELARLPIVFAQGVPGT